MTADVERLHMRDPIQSGLSPAGPIFQGLAFLRFCIVRLHTSFFVRGYLIG